MRGQNGGICVVEMEDPSEDHLWEAVRMGGPSKRK